MKDNFWNDEILIIRYCFEICSLFSYIYCCWKIYQNRLWGILAIKLFLSQALIQCLFIFIPLLLIPLFSDNTNPYQKGYINYTYCQIQGSFMLFGWMGGSLLSCWSSRIVYRVLTGKVLQKTFFYMAIVCQFLIFGTETVIAYLTSKYETFRWHYRNRPLYVFCSCDNEIYKWIEFGTELFIFIWAIFFTFLICRKEKRLRKMGLNVQNQLIQIHYIGNVQILLWLINMTVKVSETQSDNLMKAFIESIESNILLDIIWQILNLLYDLEGVIVSFMFLSLFRTQFKVKMPRFLDKLLQITCCCIGSSDKNNQKLIYEESQEDSFDEYVDSRTN